MLDSEGALEEAATLAEAERWLERHVRASDAEGVTLLLEAWRQRGSRPRRGTRAKKSKKAGAGKKPPAPARTKTSGARGGKRGAPKRSKKDPG
jgi:hypothetical protein